MLKLLADENLNIRLVLGLRRRLAEVDFVRVQDVGLTAEQDPEVLEWAATEGRVLVTHDTHTMTAFAYGRLREGRNLPGVIVVPEAAELHFVLDELEAFAGAGDPEDLSGRVIFIRLHP